MSGLKEIRNRISSVSSTMQITNAMKMVSAAKLKKAQDSITATLPYSNKLSDLVKIYLGTGISTTDHFCATLNSAVFTDGSFVYIPEGVKCPMELSTYFRINASETGQFERTLIIADKGSYVSYLEGCTAPMRDENQLHAANVELVALDLSLIHI